MVEQILKTKSEIIKNSDNLTQLEVKLLKKIKDILNKVLLEEIKILIHKEYMGYTEYYLMKTENGIYIHIIDFPNDESKEIELDNILELDDPISEIIIYDFDKVLKAIYEEYTKINNDLKRRIQKIEKTLQNI